MLSYLDVNAVCIIYTLCHTRTDEKLDTLTRIVAVCLIFYLTTMNVIVNHLDSHMCFIR